MTYDFSECLLLNTVMAARALTRRYDDKLRPFGVSVIQFSVLMTVRSSADDTVSDMANRIAMDRTTLLRNLDLLVRKGLVDDSAAKKRNGRVFVLSEEGRVLLNKIIPLWKIAQDEIHQLLGEANDEELLASLRTLRRG
ncbi:MAG: MarR family winged helix-turn-helix transcriptional regulator [Devosiaceae bacterium]|nr:MarR family winged helix-turn-helix transcriptional regulator [Devosiaceae bacterium]